MVEATTVIQCFDNNGSDNNSSGSNSDNDGENGDCGNNGTDSNDVFEDNEYCHFVDKDGIEGIGNNG